MRLARSKTGQIIGQVFIYLIGIIIIGMIVVYGYGAVKTFIQKTEDVELIQFKTTLEKALREIAVEYGSVRFKSLTVPNDFNRVCFVDTRKPADGGLSGNIGGQREAQGICKKGQPDPNDYSAIACTYWMDEDSVDNVFLIGPERVEPLFMGKSVVEDGETFSYFIIEAPDKYDCVDVRNGQIRIRLEGISKGAKLEDGWL